MGSTSSRQSGWSLQLGSVLGIPIRVHFTFFLLLIWFGFLSAKSGGNPALAVGFLLLLFGCVVLHELGHAAMARRFGVRTREIVLYPIGGIARLEGLPEGRAELLIALAGPAVNLALGVGLLLVNLGLAVPFEPPTQLSSARQLMWSLCLVNLVLFAFNLLPAFPMDGGRVLRAGLSLATSQQRATEIAAAVGQGFSILFGLWGIVSQQILPMLIALFVFIGASQEAAFYRRRAALLGKTAAAAMITRFETLSPQDSLVRASELLLATHQQDFPVVDAWRRVVGVLPRARLLEGLAQRGAEAAVLDVMERDFATVRPGDDLEPAGEGMTRGEAAKVDQAAPIALSGDAVVHPPGRQ
jgi:Zn-dependent protease